MHAGLFFCRSFYRKVEEWSVDGGRYKPRLSPEEDVTGRAARLKVYREGRPVTSAIADLQASYRPTEGRRGEVKEFGVKVIRLMRDGEA